MDPIFPVSTRLTTQLGDDSASTRAGVLIVALIAVAGLILVVGAILAPAIVNPVGPQSVGNRAIVPTALPTSAAPSAAPTSASTAIITTELADATLTTLLDTIARSTKTGDTTELAALASTAILEDVANDAQELEANGWTRTGTATVAAVTIRSNNAETGEAVVAACVDSTTVVTVDAAGEPLGAASGRALNLYTLSTDAEGWRVTARTFPDETDC